MTPAAPLLLGEPRNIFSSWLCWWYGCSCSAGAGGADAGIGVGWQCSEGSGISGRGQQPTTTEGVLLSLFVMLVVVVLLWDCCGG